MVLRSQADSPPEITNLAKPSNIGPLSQMGGQRVIDWGVGNFEADKLWDLPGARDGVIFGVMDVVPP